jgi:hypothetical protein
MEIGTANNALDTLVALLLLQLPRCGGDSLHPACFVFAL